LQNIQRGAAFDSYWCQQQGHLVSVGGLMEEKQCSNEFYVHGGHEWFDVAFVGGKVVITKWYRCEGVPFLGKKVPQDA
jgi:hypothetical protein